MILIIQIAAYDSYTVFGVTWDRVIRNHSVLPVINEVRNFVDVVEFE